MLIMQVAVEVPEQLAAEARAKGVSVEEYIEQLLSQRLNQGFSVRRVRAPEEVRAWLD